MPSLIYLNAILLAVRTIGQCLVSTIVVTYTDSYPSLLTMEIASQLLAVWQASKSRFWTPVAQVYM